MEVTQAKKDLEFNQRQLGLLRTPLTKSNRTSAEMPYPQKKLGIQRRDLSASVNKPLNYQIESFKKQGKAKGSVNQLPEISSFEDRKIVQKSIFKSHSRYRTSEELQEGQQEVLKTPRISSLAHTRGQSELINGNLIRSRISSNLKVCEQKQADKDQVNFDQAFPNIQNRKSHESFDESSKCATKLPQKSLYPCQSNGFTDSYLQKSRKQTDHSTNKLAKQLKQSEPELVTVEKASKPMELVQDLKANQRQLERILGDNIDRAAKIYKPRKPGAQGKEDQSVYYDSMALKGSEQNCQFRTSFSKIPSVKNSKRDIKSSKRKSQSMSQASQQFNNRHSHAALHYLQESQNITKPKLESQYLIEKKSGRRARRSSKQNSSQSSQQKRNQQEENRADGLSQTEVRGQQRTQFQFQVKDDKGLGSLQKLKPRDDSSPIRKLLAESRYDFQRLSQEDISQEYICPEEPSNDELRPRNAINQQESEPRRGDVDLSQILPNYFAAPQFQSPNPQKKEKKSAQQIQPKEVQQAKKERDQNKIVCYKRERDILRDWLRRQNPPTVSTKVLPPPREERGSSKKQDCSSLWVPQHGTLAQTKTEATKVPLTLAETYNLVCDKLIFSSNGRDTYFKRAAKRREADGIWMENSNPSSGLFSVKWDYGDSSVDYNKLKPHQLFNHFPDTRELTTKQGLTKNLNSITMSGSNVKEFFPRSYDLSDRAQIDLFIHDFNQTAILNVILKHAELFEEIICKIGGYQTLGKEINKQVAKFMDMEQSGIVSQRIEQQMALKQKLSSMPFRTDYAQLQRSYFINTQFLEAALFYGQNLLNETVGIALLENQTAYNHDEHFKKNCYLPEYKFQASTLELLQMYSSLQLPVNPEREDMGIPDCSADPRKRTQERLWMRLSRLKGWNSIFTLSKEQPSYNMSYLAFLVIKMSRTLEKHIPQYGSKSVDGSKNVWICKPSYNSRGFGIFCFNQKSEIINTFVKKSQAPKIVQKYIERPLLLKYSETASSQYSRDMRKFDIRQWVLLTSIEPLQVYVYKDAYLRVCGAPYDINQFDDPQRHLSNYSIQKLLKPRNFQPLGNTKLQTFETINEDSFLQDGPNEEEDELSRITISQNQKFRERNSQPHGGTQQTFLPELVMSTSEFIARLNQPSDYPEYKDRQFSWEADFYPQIKNISKVVFERMQEVFEHKPHCFELFGLDFVIDQNLKCWLIEANMSPACAQRRGQEWLTSMTDNMADGMVSIIEQKALKNLASQKIPFQGPLQERITKMKMNKWKADPSNWERIEFEQFAPKEKKGSDQSPYKQTIGQQHNEMNIEVVGRHISMKNERKLDKKYRKFMAALYIQRVFRGQRIRKRLQTSRLRRENLEYFLSIVKELASRALSRKEQEQGFAFQCIQQAADEPSLVKSQSADEFERDPDGQFIEQTALMDGVDRSNYESDYQDTGGCQQSSMIIANKSRSQSCMEENKTQRSKRSKAQSKPDLISDRKAKTRTNFTIIDKAGKSSSRQKYPKKFKPYGQEGGAIKQMAKTLYGSGSLKRSQLAHDSAKSSYSQHRGSTQKKKAVKDRKLERDNFTASQGSLRSRETLKRTQPLMQVFERKEIKIQKHGRKDVSEIQIQNDINIIENMELDMKITPENSAKILKRMPVVDPSLLISPLQLPNLSIDLIIPAPGTYFHLPGGQVIRRSKENSQNPVEVLEKMQKLELQALQQQYQMIASQQQNNGSIFQQQSKPSKQSVYDIYGVRQKLSSQQGVTSQFGRTQAQGFGKNETSKKSESKQIDFQKSIPEQSLSFGRLTHQAFFQQRGKSRKGNNNDDEYNHYQILQRINHCYQVVQGNGGATVAKRPGSKGVQLHSSKFRHEDPTLTISSSHQQSRGKSEKVQEAVGFSPYMQQQAPADIMSKSRLFNKQNSEFPKKSNYPQKFSSQNVKALKTPVKLSLHQGGPNQLKTQKPDPMVLEKRFVCSPQDKSPNFLPDNKKLNFKATLKEKDPNVNSSRLLAPILRSDQPLGPRKSQLPPTTKEGNLTSGQKQRKVEPIDPGLKNTLRHPKSQKLQFTQLGIHKTKLGKKTVKQNSMVQHDVQEPKILVESNPQLSCCAESPKKRLQLKGSEKQILSTKLPLQKSGNLMSSHGARTKKAPTAGRVSPTGGKRINLSSKIFERW